MRRSGIIGDNMLEDGGLFMKRYKKSAPTVLVLALVIAFSLMTSQKADSRTMTNVNPDISGEELRAVVIEDFEAAKITDDLHGDGWYISTTPKKYESAKAEANFKRKDPVVTLEMKLINGGPSDLAVEQWSVTELGKAKENVLGVKFRFRYPGTNSVHIHVPKEVEWKTREPILRLNPASGKEEQDRGIQLPGRAKAISVWVHGRGTPYDLEAWLVDYKGDTHIIKFGSTNFVGWRPMRAQLPTNLPQSYESYPQTKVTRLTMFVLRAQVRSHYEELTTDTYYFFDQIKVLTDSYEVNFDGRELHEAFDAK